MGHSLGYAVNCSILLTELPLLERPAAAKTLGFDAIELWWPFPKATPSDAEVDHLCSAVEEAGVRLIALNLFSGDMTQGERGVVSWPASGSEFRDNVDVVVGISERLGVDRFNALYGNRVTGVAAEEQDETAVENLVFAAERLASISGTVLIEPISGPNSYPLRHAEEAIAVIDTVRAASGRENLGLLADLYHLAANGDDVDRMIADHASRVAHVQIADLPGRNEPGTGTLPLAAQLEALQEAGYAGWVGLEYSPSGTSFDSFTWLDPARRGSA